MNWVHGHFGPRKAERFFKFLARGGSRFHVWVLGFSHLVLIVGWDTKGKTPAPLLDPDEER
jgi:hypothetical protein